MDTKVHLTLAIGIYIFSQSLYIKRCNALNVSNVYVDCYS